MTTNRPKVSPTLQDAKTWLETATDDNSTLPLETKVQQAQLAQAAALVGIAESLDNLAKAGIDVWPRN